MKDELKCLLKRCWFMSSKEAEEAKEIISQNFEDKDFEFKVDWEDIQKDIITINEIKARI
jgi:hypothetical protein